MEMMRVSAADSCDSRLVHISHHRCWLEEFTLPPWLHGPLCDPRCQSALLIPSKPLAPLPRDVLSLTWLAAIVWAPTPPHISVDLPPSLLWVLVFPETPISSDPQPLHLLHPPKLLLSQTPQLQQPQLPRLSTT